MTTPQSLKSIREIANLTWSNGIPSPFKDETNLSKNFEEAANYLTQIAQLAQQMKEQEGEAYLQIKEKSWTYVKTIKTSDQYLKIAAICTDCLGLLSSDKPMILLFEEQTPLALPFYIKEYLERESPYFSKLFSGWAKEKSSPMITLESVTLENFKHTIQLLDHKWLFQKLFFHGPAQIKDLELIEVIRIADYLGLISAGQRAAEQVVTLIQKWNAGDFKQITIAQSLIAQSANYAHRPEVSKALNLYINQVKQNLKNLVSQIKNDFKNAQELIDSGICNHHPELIEAIQESCQNQLYSAQDHEKIAQILDQVKLWPIQELTLPSLLLTESHITQISSFPHLQTLKIQDRDEVEFLTLLNSKSLKKIYFIRCQNVSKRVLEHLSTLPMTSFIFDSCGIKNIHLSRLRHSKITHLSLIHCPHLTSSGLSHLIPLPLVSFSLAQNKNLLELRFLKSFKNLEELILDIKNLSNISFLHGKKLKTLKLSAFSQYSANLRDLIKEISIQNLILEGDWVTEENLKDLNEAKIQQLNLENCPKISRPIKKPFQFVDWLKQPTVKSVTGSYRNLIGFKDKFFVTEEGDETKKDYYNSYKGYFLKIWDKSGNCLHKIPYEGSSSYGGSAYGFLADGTFAIFRKDSKKIELWNEKGSTIIKDCKFESEKSPDEVLYSFNNKCFIFKQPHLFKHYEYHKGSIFSNPPREYYESGFLFYQTDFQGNLVKIYEENYKSIKESKFIDFIDLGYGVRIPHYYSPPQNEAINDQKGPLKFLGEYNKLIQLEENVLVTLDSKMSNFKIWEFPYHNWDNHTS